MIKISKLVTCFLDDTPSIRNLSKHTVRAYTIDLNQFLEFCKRNELVDVSELTLELIETYIITCNKLFLPRTIRRKYASLKQFIDYLTTKSELTKNPLKDYKLKVRKPAISRKVLSEEKVQLIWKTLYDQLDLKKVNENKQKFLLRDILVFEILYQTGVRVGELVNMRSDECNLATGEIRICGKGQKFRTLFITSKEVLYLLNLYAGIFKKEISKSEYLFVNNRGSKISDQSVRYLIQKHSLKCRTGILTPHTIRHTCATSLVRAGVNLRVIQSILGHSSITTTQIYTHIDNAMIQASLSKFHPRNIEVRLS